MLDITIVGLEMNRFEFVMFCIAWLFVGGGMCTWFFYNLVLKHILPGPDVGETKYDDVKKKKS